MTKTDTYYFMRNSLIIPITLLFLSQSSCSTPDPSPYPPAQASDHSQIELAANHRPESTDPLQLQVHTQLQHLDSILFTTGFVQGDTAALREIIASDLEFYQDQSGVMHSRKEFFQSVIGLQNLPYKATRKLDSAGLTVHLLRNNGELYGALQEGRHHFYAENDTLPKHLTSTADFTHLWLLEDALWKLKRVVSYNHHSPEDQTNGPQK